MTAENIDSGSLTRADAIETEIMSTGSGSDTNPVRQAVAQLADPEFRADPYSRYRVLREAGPFHSTSYGMNLATRYADCAAVLSSPNWGHDNQAARLHPTRAADEFPAVFLWMEPPDHTRLRGLVSKAFTPRRVAALRPRIQALAAALVDDMLAAGTSDLISAMAYPLPLTIICEILGVPAEDHPVIQRWSHMLARALDPDATLPAAVLADRNTAIPEFLGYFLNLVRRERLDPGPSILGALVQVEEKGEKLTDSELLGTCILLVVAGHETTVNQIGNGMLALLRHPDQVADLPIRRDLMPSAVNELLRYDAPVQMVNRFAKERVTVGGRVFEAGEGVTVLIASANRDGSAFPEPDRLDLTRYQNTPGTAPANRHLSFSLGHHYCLGTPLALLEMEVLLGEVLDRVTVLDLCTDTPSYKPDQLVRGLAELPVSFRA
ncbi:cytochrome P450 [Frankia sp. CcI49]|uniref:cytochrome P450 n=1 Tax=Frankia sp. CcI49 TaxID=1745382 RepID=UPI0026AEB3FB